MVARSNYLTQDRSDIQFASKEVSKRIAEPDEEAQKKLTRLARYLKHKPRSIVRYDYQAK